MEKTVRLYYIECGKGKPLILLHGNQENSSYFKSQIKEFSMFYHVFALDTRGHGKTPHGEDPFTLKAFSEDLFCFFNEHDICRAHILGFSDGANIAMLFALSHPEKVDKLILNGGNYQFSGLKFSVRCSVFLQYKLARLCSSFSKRALRYAEMMALMLYEPNLTELQLSKIDAETLILIGNRDVIRKKHSEDMAKIMPHARLEIIEGRHYIAKTNPKVFNKKILSFLAEI